MVSEGGAFYEHHVKNHVREKVILDFLFVFVRIGDSVVFWRTIITNWRSNHEFSKKNHEQARR
jgi:hypothetical protein